MKSKADHLTLPGEFFRAFAILLPDLLRLIEQCGLNGVEIFTLVYLANHGTEIDNKQRGLLRRDFTELLRREFRYSDGDVDLHLGRMEEKGLVLRQRLTHEQKQKFFKTDKGRLAVVVLLPRGLEKTDELKGSLSALFAEVLEGLPGTFLPLFVKTLPLLTRVARSVVDSAQGRRLAITN